MRNRRFSDHTTIPTRDPSEYPEAIGAREDASQEPTDDVSRRVRTMEGFMDDSRPSDPAEQGALVKALGGPTRLIRHFITGELVEVPLDSPDGRVFIAAGGKPCEKILPRRDYNRVFTPLSIAPEQATPERIAKENAEAKRHNTGAYYTPDGECHTTSRRSQNREMKRKGRINNSGGYGDWCGR